MQAEYKVGTSGWAYAHWQGPFYPEHLGQDQWLEFYQDHFPTVEVNNTFYQLPEAETLKSWRGRAKAGFVYTLKANRYITHMKKLKDAQESVPKFLERARKLGSHLGPILWQLPPNWHADPGRFENFAKVLSDDLTHVFEFRDSDWFQDPIREILEDHNLSFCIYNMPNRPCPEWVTSDTVYLRFHGLTGEYRGEYGRESLEPWAERMRAWLDEGLSLYAYFNNDEHAYATDDARRLIEILRQVG
jgi:uncharacterized protein YecE (DUF72 family)